MNILIVNDDGPQAYGLKLLQQKAKQVFRDAPMVTLSLEGPAPGKGTSVTCPTPNYDIYPLEEIGKNHFVAKGLTPTDLVVLAYQAPHRFFRRGQFEVVLSGVNLGANVGLDTFCSGTISPCLLAATAFGWGAMAFSQALPNKLEDSVIPDGQQDQEYYACADHLLAEVFLQYVINPGECFSINFPDKDTPFKNFYHTQVANFSRWWMRPTEAPPPGTDCDIYALKQGFVTISELEWRINPSMRM